MVKVSTLAVEWIEIIARNRLWYKSIVSTLAVEWIEIFWFSRGEKDA